MQDLVGSSTPLYSKPFEIQDLAWPDLQAIPRKLCSNSVPQTTICVDPDYIWLRPTTESPTACQSIVLPKYPCLGLQAKVI